MSVQDLLSECEWPLRWFNSIFAESDLSLMEPLIRASSSSWSEGQVERSKSLSLSEDEPL